MKILECDRRHTSEHMRKQRFAGVLSCLTCLLFCIQYARAIEAQIEVGLAVPECGLLLNPDDRAELPKEQISKLVLQVRPRVGAVRYGSIRVVLNGESINRQMTINGTAAGYDCVIESPKDSSLPLHPGDNTVDVSLTDTWNHAHSARFTLVIPKRG